MSKFKKASRGTDRKHNVEVNFIDLFCKEKLRTKTDSFRLEGKFPIYSGFKQKSRFYLKIVNEKRGRS